MDLLHVGRPDLLFRDADGDVLVDEVKSGAFRFGKDGSVDIPPAVRDQVQRYVAGMGRVHGSAFVGLRLVILQAPRAAVFVDRSGDWLPLAEWAPGAIGSNW